MSQMATLSHPSSGMAMMATDALDVLAAACSVAAARLTGETLYDDSRTRLQQTMERLIQISTDSRNQSTATNQAHQAARSEVIGFADSLLREFYYPDPSEIPPGDQLFGLSRLPSLEQLYGGPELDRLCTFLQQKAEAPQFASNSNDLDRSVSEPFWDANSLPCPPSPSRWHSRDIEETLWACLLNQTECACDFEPGNRHDRHLRKLAIRCPPLKAPDESGDKVTFSLRFASAEEKCREFGQCKSSTRCKHRSIISVRRPSEEAADGKHTNSTRDDGKHKPATQAFHDVAKNNTYMLDPATGQLCEELRLHHGIELAFFVHRDDELGLRLRKLHPYSSSKSAQTFWQSQLSLDDMLRENNNSRTFEPRQQLALAYCIALTVWQYYDTHWMHIPFSREQIHIVKEERKLTFPYVAPHHWSNDSKSHERLKHQFMGFVYPKVMALGILLIEICQQSPFSDRDQRDLSGDLIFHNYSNFYELIRGFQQKWLPDYVEVVKKCFERTLFKETETWDVESRRQILFEQIVVPLERLYLYGAQGMTLRALPDSNIYNTPSPLIDNTDDENPAWPYTDSSVRHRSRKGQLLSDAKQEFEDVNKMLKTLESRDLTQLPTQRRVKIAVLDTGCSPGILGANLALRTKRLQWLDYVEPGNTKCALKHVALTEKVDIVSMSFGFKSNDTTVSNTISYCQNMRKRDILFFAAANNLGTAQKEMFPAAQYLDVISVRGTNLYDSFMDQYNAEPHPGWQEQVSERCLFGTLATDGCDGAWLHIEGCSIATPILAATASLFLQYIMYLCRVYPHYDWLLQRLFQKEYMMRLFKQVGSKHDEEKRCFVAPRRLFTGLDDIENTSLEDIEKQIEWQIIN
ncbi:hypothetical protein G7Z17_g2996 [Cylindrodendrum hubeiense]|uniref:Peptidase S8/S53 domain-containing protein n=1 Tax=Cylindrodendrum hubeiense TaxID=595255 RepID=A0A9P5HGN8_9HYPO|nr:hypothetical protein G7Z17_g2996 [Cylindrodendrum hubeiense]